MPYVTTYKAAKGKEISLDQVLLGDVDTHKIRKERKYPGTVTKFYESLPDNLYPKQDVQHLISKLKQLPYINREYPADMTDEYWHHQIPKKSGGMRDIYEPKQELNQFQILLRTLLEKDFNASYHTSAFAYCKGRSTLFCIRRHQANQSRWFLKIDFSDFFGSTTPDFVWRQLSQIAPFSEVIKEQQGAAAMRKALQICYLNNGLPQGTCISPMLTNIVMIPIDHEISNTLHEKGFVYTRYADDIQISHKNHFKYEEIIDTIIKILEKHNAPYNIKHEKTRYGSIAGRNWNLGLMLNGNNDITIGHREHKIMKAKLHQFVLDYKNKRTMSDSDLAKLMGEISYFKSIEPKTLNHIIDCLNKKYKVSIEKIIKVRTIESQSISILRSRSNLIW